MITVSIIGFGNVGGAISLVASSSEDIVLDAIYVRDVGKSRESMNSLNIEANLISIEKCVELMSDLVLICVPDSAIISVASLLAEKCEFGIDTTVAHTSGALSSAELKLVSKFCHTGSLHPLQTFPDPAKGAKSLNGSFAFCEGDSIATTILRKFCGKSGMRYSEIEPENKAAYHLSAVVACNYLSVLMKFWEDCVALAGVDTQDAVDGFTPLIEATLSNCLREGSTTSLTGPIVRGDVATVASHLAVLAGSPLLSDLYSRLGAMAVGMSLAKDSLSSESASLVLRELKKGLK